eukprot:CAMPEP_0179925504 /NCGR_PEP_ID=MMETSP0983-20121128/7293_1 /TAXON_ID=483367 /ORGANISM="non described non described, Strain CCMP 2436" /LENGTH=125 /DNA_ID=CAMNT_0021829093 /DNA_START=511 /DNA_END=890 /DNA_ORIENTATION=+
MRRAAGAAPAAARTAASPVRAPPPDDGVEPAEAAELCARDRVWLRLHKLADAQLGGAVDVSRVERRDPCVKMRLHVGQRIHRGAAAVASCELPVALDDAEAWSEPSANEGTRSAAGAATAGRAEE